MQSSTEKRFAALDWRDPNAYRFADTLSPAQWAWEFLRRNPDYRREWLRFWATWQALEAEYGCPPHRDFTRWQQDPRAYVLAGESDPADSCRVAPDKVLIECWMGARWGFYKFPLDPATDAPVIGQQLVWRPLDSEVLQVDENDADYLGGQDGKLALGFDLRLPLREQIESAKRFLLAEQRRLRHEQDLQPRSVANLSKRWIHYLRALDGEAAGAGTEELAEVLFADVSDPRRRLEAAGTCLTEAHALRDGGYRRIAFLPES
jgi:hypothetical protein